MAANDLAVVIGINRYPRISDLRAPASDAIRFYLWLRHPQGGNVPKDRVHLRLSPIRHERWGKQPTNYPHIDPVFKQIVKEGEGRRLDGSGERLGRRFYLFLAGHGIQNALRERYVALLLADADLGAMACEHVPGLVFAERLHWTGYFDEVVLFMDTCREECLLVGEKPFYNVLNQIPHREPKKFFGLAAQPGKLAVEAPAGPRRWAGRFTSYVLDGLYGKACDEDGAITGESLKKYVNRRFATLIARTPRTLQESISYPYFDNDDDIVFSPAVPAPPLSTPFVDVKVTSTDGSPLPELHLVSAEGEVVAVNLTRSKEFRRNDSTLVIAGLAAPGLYYLRSTARPDQALRGSRGWRDRRAIPELASREGRALRPGRSTSSR